MSATLSIIIPIYNAKLYLEECINSVASDNLDNLDNLEVILIDDGSSDGSKDIINKYKNSFNNIRVFEQANQGVFITRNKGIAEAKGEYLLFLDADDYLTEGAIDYLVKILKKEHYDIIFFGLKLIGNKAFLKSKPYIPKINQKSNILRAMFLDNKSIAGYMGGKIIRKSIAEQAVHLIDYKDDRIELYEDCLFLFCVSIYCKTALNINSQLYMYRIHESSVTQRKNTPQQIIEKLKISKSYFKALEKSSTIKANIYSKDALSKINRVIDSSILIQNAKQSHYIRNIYHAWLLDSRIVNLARIVIHIVTFGNIKK